MKTLTWVFVSLLVFSNLVFAQNGWRKGEMEIKIKIESLDQAQKLKSINLAGEYYPNNTARLYVVESELSKLKSLGIEFEILETNLDTRVFDATFDAYHSYDQIIDLMDSLETAFPNICKKYMAGTSLGGRELAYLKISDNVNSDETEPEIFFDAGIHGDEIAGQENTIRFARFLCTEYSSNSTISDLVDNREIFLYPMVNPDGRVAMSRYNNNGVDLNRDWGYMWNGEGSSSGAYSQVESKALRDVMYNNQFVVHTTFHGGIECISQPWSYRSSQCADHSHIDNLGGVYSSTSGYSNLPHYQGNTGMYPINGSTKDCNYGIRGSVSWSMEVSEDKQPPASQIGYYYNINEPAMLAMIEYSGYGVNGVVTDASTGDPIPAVIFVEDLFPVYADPTAGDFHKWVLPGTYDITIIANGYDTEVVTGIVVDADGTDLIPITMTANSEENYAHKIVSCQIPDNNDADEGLTFKMLGADDNDYYSIGKNGWIVFDMQESISDKQGNDIKIYQGNTTAEGYTLYASDNIDGPYYNIGTGSGTTEFDLADGGVLSARYFKLVDDGDGQAVVNDAGFDFDAAQKLPSASGPYLLVESKSISEVSGNGNGRIDPGETIDFTVNLFNNGDDPANNISGTLSCVSEYVTLTTASGDFGSLNPGEQGSATFTFEISEDAPEATPFTLILNVNANGGSYVNSYNYNYSIGLVVEDFETGGFTSFPWTFSGNANWQAITGSNVYEGTYSAQSGDINDNQQSTLEVEIDVPMDDAITFFIKVSCEDGSSDDWDYLVFLIDGVEQERWDGEIAWTEVQFPVTAGTHTFTWTYSKDVTVSAGSDCAWIDYIVMPGSGSTPSTLEVEASATPTVLCSGETTQLLAVASGGSENYTYSWEPSDLVSNPAIANPTATLTESNTFTVTVDDGVDQVIATVSVNVNPIPEAPTATLTEGILYSNAQEGNQWYNSNGAITGANEQSYIPNESGLYYTIVTLNGCSSEPSNEVNVTIGIDEFVASSITIKPNPSKGTFMIDSDLEIELVQIFSIAGNKEAEYRYLPENNMLNVSNLNKGIYFIKLNLNNQFIVVKKLIIE